MHIHILGICGTFMGGLAVLAREAGHTVTGCDANVYPPMSTQLEEQGIELVQGYGEAQIELKPDLFVVGNVVSRGNPLMEAVMNRGLPYCSGPEWLGRHLLADRWVLAVAGTHGKTTTTSMLAWILEDCGYNPGFLIGGVPKNFGISARCGGDPFFVIEADEYDTAFFDKRSKFVHYRPKTVVLNNLEFDHADIFPDLAAIETQFHHLVRTIPGVGQIIANGSAPAIERVLARGAWSPIERFGTPAAWHLREDHGGVGVFRGADALGRLHCPIPGRHNEANALAAVIAARHVGVRTEEALASLARFEGVKRRLDLRGTVGGIAVYDDFAHHPTAIEATISALRSARSIGESAKGRVIAVLEPRSNTMKLGVMKAQLAPSLTAADLVFGYGAASGRDALGWDLAEALAPLGEKARTFDAIDPLVAAIAAAVRPGDAVLFMSNGGFGGIHDRLLAKLADTPHLLAKEGLP